MLEESKLKYKIFISAILMSMVLAGCKEEEVVPGPVTETMYKPEVEKEKIEEVTIRTENKGYILEDKEREMVDGANFHDLGDLTEDDGFIVRPTSPALSEDKLMDSKEPKAPNGIKIYLDPGHGGDAGGETVLNGVACIRPAGGAEIGQFPANSLGTTVGTSGGGYSECDVVYQMALNAKELLELNGYTVEMSREDVHPAAMGGGTAIGNWERGRRASECDAWITFHADGGGGKGIHCVVFNSDSTYSNKLCDDFISYLENKSRPIYTASGFHKGYSGNSSVFLQGPAMFIQSGGNVDNLLYIEAGFMDNQEDLDYMVSEQGKSEIADAILYALNEHFYSTINSVSSNTIETTQDEDISEVVITEE